ncbi:MAG: hypothetical protein K8H75_07480 [Sulfuricella sp.]|nr:hypothetical protein [Sulfuricella sp.]
MSMTGKVLMNFTSGVVPRVLGRIFLVLMLGVTMNACSSSESWKEEVQLSDGRIIVVERETLHERGGDEWASNRSGSKPKERRIRFAYPGESGQMVEWRSIKKSPQTWPEKPLILDTEAGQPIIFSLVAISPGCETYSKYVYRNGVWIEEELPEKFEQRTTNLFIRDGTDMPQFVDLETKRKGNAEIGYRRALKQVGPTRQVCG